jgi:hypothetical protein
VEVLNAGQPGYSTTMMSWLFGEVIAEYRPDWVLVFVPMHDTNLVLVSDQEVLSGGSTFSDQIRVGLARQSRIYSVLRKMLFPFTEQAWLLPGQHTSEPRVPRVSDSERTAALDAIRSLLQGWGGHLVVAYLPFKGDIEDNSSSSRPTSAWAHTYGADRQVPVLELQRCCAGENGLILADDPGHLSEAGNARVGAVLGAALSKLLSPS